MPAMLSRCARRSVLVGSPSSLRHCRCPECQVSVTTGAQRAFEKRQWKRAVA